MKQIIEQTIRDFAGYVERPRELTSAFCGNGRHQWRAAGAKDRSHLQTDRAKADAAVVAAWAAEEASKGFPVATADVERLSKLLALQGAVTVTEHVEAFTAPRTVQIPSQPAQGAPSKPLAKCATTTNRKGA